MKYLITGGAGFIGSNFAEKLLKMGERVTIFNDLSRRGSETNLLRLKKLYPRLSYVRADVSRDLEKLKAEVKQVDVVFHLAAQVGVSTSVLDPRRDFEINALGTFNILEAVRLAPRQPMLLYASTNKVYGGLEDLLIDETKTNYKFKNITSVSESQIIDFHSPYGCSKGIGDQYVRDYSRIYGLKTVVFRQSCIYGPGQFGTEDQGWVAWFLIAALLGLPIIYYGNGKQTRDILYIDDLFSAWMAAVNRIDRVAGMVFNIGGGPELAISLQELVNLLNHNFGLKTDLKTGPWRPGDQKIYISDIRLAEKELAWQPQVSIVNGLESLYTWIKDREQFISSLFMEQSLILEEKIRA